MLFKKKKPRRPVFGFLCSPTLAALIRGTARNLRLPIFCLAEHVVQAGLAVILPQLEDEGFRERLCAHLIESHLLVDAAGENEYDRAAMAEARQKEVARLEREKVIRLLVNEVESAGMPPRLIMQAVKVLIEAAEARRKGQKVKGMDSGEVSGRRGEPKPVY